MFREQLSEYSTNLLDSTEYLWDVVGEILWKMTLNDEVSGHATSDYKHFQKTQIKTEDQVHNKEESEVINNKSYQKFRKTAVQCTRYGPGGTADVGDDR